MHMQYFFTRFCALYQGLLRAFLIFLHYFRLTSCDVPLQMSTKYIFDSDISHLRVVLCSV